MEQKKNLCAQISLSLHTQICEARETAGQTTSEYITNLLIEYYNLKKSGGTTAILKDGQVIGTEATKTDGSIIVTDVTEGLYAFVEVSAPAPYRGLLTTTKSARPPGVCLSRLRTRAKRLP